MSFRSPLRSPGDRQRALGAPSTEAIQTRPFHDALLFGENPEVGLLIRNEVQLSPLALRLGKHLLLSLMQAVARTPRF